MLEQRSEWRDADYVGILKPSLVEKMSHLTEEQKQPFLIAPILPIIVSLPNDCCVSFFIWRERIYVGYTTNRSFGTPCLSAVVAAVEVSHVYRMVLDVRNIRFVF